MISARSLAGRLSIIALVVGGLCGAAFADNSHERTQFGHNISVGPDEEVSEVTCFGCSVHIRGKVQGDVTVFGGNILVEDVGEVGGDTAAFGGDVRLEKGATVNDLTVFGGRLHRDPAATVNGDVTTFTGSIWLVIMFGLPLAMLGALIALIVLVIRRFMRPATPLAA
jgi:hypothetical protein